MAERCCDTGSHSWLLDRRAFLRSAGTLAAAAAASGLPSRPAEAQSGEVRLTWHGQATTVIETAGKTLLVDAFFGQHPAGVPSRAPDLLLLTHGHGDHFGITLELLDRFPSLKLAGHSELVRNLVAFKLAPPGQIIDVNRGGRLVAGRVVAHGAGATPPASPFPDVGVEEIIVVPADHSSSLFLPPNRVPPAQGGGTLATGGEALGYVIRLRSGFTLYHAGDTNVFEDMRLIRERFRPDLALVPIGGNFTMDPVDAALATADLLKPRFVIPIHHPEGAPPGSINPALYGRPEAFVRALGPRQDITVVIPARGQTVRLTGAGPTARVELV